MELYKIRNLSFTYPGRFEKAVDSIDLSVKRGEFITICGHSGCGKTTLLRLLKPTISPHGEKSGEILFMGGDIETLGDKEQAKKIGFVMQNPENQIVTDKVWHEMSFGLESMGIKTPEMRAKVAEMASFFGIENWFYKKTAELSGGQKQMLNLASAMVIEPDALILDEPTAMLDPIAAGEFLSALKKINVELGVTVILAEHRLEDAAAISDRLIVMEKGRIISDSAPDKAGEILKEKGSDMFDALPTATRVFCGANGEGRCPVTVREGKDWLLGVSNKLDKNVTFENPVPHEKPVIEVKEAFFRYERDAEDVIKNLNLTLFEGEFLAILGGNGTGKTTALSLISGINKANRGEILIKGNRLSQIKNPYNGLLGVLPQEPKSLFNKKTVFDELMNMTDKKADEKAREDAALKVVALCRIENLLKSHPYDLSGGEQQRVALSMILLKKPQILVMDEPTKGMDTHFKKIFAHILQDLKKGGASILMVSHDVEFCAEFADRCAMFFDGAVTAIESTREFFKNNFFYTTGASRMARDIIPDAVLAKDIIIAFGGEYEEEKTEETHIDYQPDFTEKEPKTAPKERKYSKYTALIMAAIVPLTVFFGVYFLGDRKYYFISLLIVLETLIPFFAMFEKGKKGAREIAVVSVLCAIGVAGRIAFFMVPELKPLLAIVILSGVCLGGEVGFLVGAMSAFLSNFFFGQGPWTPWQMFAFGLVGFLAGVMFGNGILKKSRLSLALFGFFSALIIYGGIMNPASVLMVTTDVTSDMIYSAFLVGFPIDLVHAAATAVFLWFLGKPFIEKLERIKTKYGLL